MTYLKLILGYIIFLGGYSMFCLATGLTIDETIKYGLALTGIIAIFVGFFIMVKAVSDNLDGFF